ncbi:hypothetical protein [Enterococcus mundtii]|uniref:hypothetical protein n=1 Tax=Enterococcus mundtii TaxID=53346 RepID=UPI0013784FEA|nr:hypothetical protein [Enterococcus mundtii]NBA62681.1 hypothetical protein [Enterococcus mundtii]
MTKLKTSKVMEETARKAIEQAKKQGFQIDKDDFEIVQPFDDELLLVLKDQMRIEQSTMK